MLSLPLSQVETRFSGMNPTVAVPIAIAASTKTRIQFRFTASKSEMVLMQALGGQVTFDSAQLSGGVSYGGVTSLRWGSNITFLPCQTINLTGDLFAVFSLILSGVSVQQGDILDAFIEVINADAALPHNVTAATCTLMHQPVRLADDPSLTQLIDRRAFADAEALQRRLR